MRGKSFKNRAGKPIGKRVGKSKVLEGRGGSGSGGGIPPAYKGGTAMEAPLLLSPPSTLDGCLWKPNWVQVATSGAPKMPKGRLLTPKRGSREDFGNPKSVFGRPNRS